jgi:putative methyltransferase (TIGR04325 family)
VDCGNKYFEDENLKFFYDIETCIALQMPNAILLSCVIQYLENPYKLLEKISAIGFKFIIFDRTAFYFEQKDRLTLQKVHTKIYEASYPAWFLNKKKFFDVFTKRYKVVANWSENIDNANIPSTFEGGMLEQGKCLD